MKKSEAINTFNEGLVMDANPLVASNKGLCNALNATFITMNGNENVLLNDMGNGRVETAYLPEGYIPIGTTEFGGIIYIVSYNPLIDKCLIGSFPSPERNITSAELSKSDTTIVQSDFKNSSDEIVSTIVKKKLSDNILHPGDKFIVCSKGLSNNKDCISNLNGDTRNINLKLATIDNNGRIIQLSDLNKYKLSTSNDYYYIKEGTIDGIDLDEYRKSVNSAYNIFTSKIAGLLYIVSELETIDTFTVTWKLTAVNKPNFDLEFTISTSSKNNKFILYIKFNNDFYERDSSDSDSELQIKHTVAVNGPDKERTFEFTPCMTYGILKLFYTKITIDFSLFESDLVNSTMWRYYKEESQMILSYNLNSYLLPDNNIEYFKLYFIPYNLIPNTGYNFDNNLETTLDSRWFYKKIENRKSYSGYYNDKISFSDKLNPDSLYIVLFFIKIKKLNGTYINKHFYRCLYTNGVFNSKYLDEVDDFDNITIDFDYELSLKSDEDFVLDSNVFTNPKFNNTINPLYIHGCIKTDIKSEIKVNPKISLKEDYNTFSTNENISVNNITINKKTLETSSQLYNTGNSNVEPKYVKIIQLSKDGLIIDNPVKNDSEKGDWYNVTYDNITKTLSFTGEVYNKMSSNTLLKLVDVKNYYRPVASTPEQFEKYGLTYDTFGFKFTNNSEFYGLGLSNTNAYNTKYDRLTYASAKVNLEYAENNFILKNVQWIPSRGPHSFEGFSIPNKTLNEELITYSNNIFIPVLMVNFGLGLFELISDNMGKETVQIHDTAIVSDPNEKEAGVKVFYFESEQRSYYRYFWIFIKQISNGTPYYYPVKWFKVTDETYKTRITDLYGTIIDTTVPTILGSFLLSTFVKISNKNLANVYICKDVSFFDLITYLIKCICSCNINSENLLIIFNKNKTLNSISDSVYKFTGNTYSCLSVVSKPSKLNLPINYKFNTRNDLKDKYLEVISSLRIDEFVENPIDDKEIKVRRNDKIVFLRDYILDNNNDFNLINISNGKFVPDLNSKLTPIADINLRFDEINDTLLYDNNVHSISNNKKIAPLLTNEVGTKQYIDFNEPLFINSKS